MARTWVDYGKEGKPKRYKSKKAVLALIKGILEQDDDLLTVVGSLDKVQEDTLFEIGSNHYSILEE